MLDGVAGDEPVRVLVVDDSEAARRALGEVVLATEGFALVGCCESGEQALRSLAGLDPDLVLLDVRMPGLDGPTTARLTTATRPDIGVVFVSATEPLPMNPEIAGAVALPKRSVSPTTLVEAWLDARELLDRAAEARQTSRDRIEEAEAVQAQARHQIRRAGRWREQPSPSSDPG
jgi:CheY-like chemotaxis protein